MKLPASLLILLAFTSCTFIYTRTVLGIRKPHIESCKSLTSYLSKEDVDTMDAYILSDSLYLTLISTSNKYFSKYEVYNSNFQKLELKDSVKNQCYGNIQRELMTIGQKDAWQPDTNIQLKFEVLQRHLKTLNGVSMTSGNFQRADYYIVFYWAKFMGTYTRSILEIAGNMQQQNKASHKIMTINMDLNDQMSDSLQQIEINVTRRKKAVSKQS